MRSNDRIDKTMKQTLSEAQEYINNRIDVLRLEKDELKSQICDLAYKITEIDRVILELRQSFSLNEPVKLSKHEQKLEKELERVTRELDELKTKLGVNQ